MVVKDPRRAEVYGFFLYVAMILLSGINLIRSLVVFCLWIFNEDLLAIELFGEPWQDFNIRFPKVTAYTRIPIS